MCAFFFSLFALNFISITFFVVVVVVVVIVVDVVVVVVGVCRRGFYTGC